MNLDIQAITTENWQKYQDEIDNQWAELNLPLEDQKIVGEIVELNLALESVREE